MNTLPSNPRTISDGRLRANEWTVDDVRRRHGDMTSSDAAVRVRQDLDELRAWDDYERATRPGREAVKPALRALLR